MMPLPARRLKRFFAVIAVLLAVLAPISIARASLQPEEARASHGAGSHGASEAPEEEGGPPGAIKWFDTQLLNNKQPPYAALLFNFAVLIFIYYRFGKVPIANALKARRDGISKEIDRAAGMLKEAKDRARRYRAKLDKVKDEAEKAKQTNIDTGKGKADEIVRNADEKAGRIKREAEFLLEQETKQVRIDLQRETVEKATREAEELLKKGVTADDQERLAQAFLDQLMKDYKEGSLHRGDGGVS